MSKKTKLKDMVRELLARNPIVTFGPSATVALMCPSTGKIRIERIRLDWWEDEDFRYGYEGLRADEGFILGSEVNPASQTTDELESRT